MKEEKAELRRKMRRMRGSLTPEDLALAAEHVVPHVLSLPGIDAGPVLLYISFRRELPTEPLFRAFWDRGIDVVVPAVTRSGMEARRRTPTSRLVVDDTGIPTTEGPPETARWALCPGLAFDRAGRRLGYGGGYYDRWLAAHGATAVGLCVDAALIEAVPGEPHDVRMTAIVTPSGVWPVSGKSV
jgi:5-formyltetrahydrofolate cyclo-ligase